MQFGRHLRELWSHRTGLIVSLAIATLMSLWSIGKVSLFPPGLKERQLTMAAANTRVLVDSPRSAVLDTNAATASLQAMSNRGVLEGNVMASDPVLRYIGRRARIPWQLLRVASPVTPDFPRPLETQLSGKKSPKDILKWPNEYRLSIQANPTVPILDIYAEAPTPQLAQQLANGAVDGMRDYLRDVARRQQIPAARSVQLEQLGRAQGTVINPGVRLKLGVITFLIVFGAASLTVLALDRVRRGWRLGSPTRRDPGGASA
jgi:hypothetical protein